MSEIEKYAASVLGPIEHISDHSRRTGRVVEVVDQAGGQWIIKTVPTAREFRRERHAYTHWVPHFADQAPELKGANLALRTLILERLPGYTDWSFDPADHREAGRLLRRIHQAAPTRHGGPGIGALAEDKLHVSLQRLPEPNSIDTDGVEFVQRAAATLHSKFDHLPRVPTHGDYGGHNWLLGADRLRVIDFSTAQYNAAAADFARLFIGPWWERPDLSIAFFDGYGRPITDEELECVRLQLPAFAISLIAHGRRHRDHEMEGRGQHRLRKLMDGHDFTRSPRGIRRHYHAARRLASKLGSRRHPSPL